MSDSVGSATMHLPRAIHSDFAIFDKRRMMAGGWLKKKAGTSGGSLFNKGSWQRRWFSIDSEVTGLDNYELEYYHYPDDKKPRQKFPLEGASLNISGSTSFQINLADGTMLQLKADDDEKFRAWYVTLETLIIIASKRAQAIHEMLMLGMEGTRGEHYDDDEYDDRHSDPKSPMHHFHHRNPFKINHRANPLVRLDLDINTIPPSSTHRRQFEEMFVSDVSRALGVPSEIIEVISVKPAPNSEWLVEVEFDIYIPPPPRDEDDDDMDEAAERELEELQREREEQQKSLLTRLHAMVINSASPLYYGFITCKLDSTFAAHMVEEEEEDDLFSSDPAVLSVMHKYKDVAVPDDFIDTSHFEIHIAYEGKEYPFYVPNPSMLRRRWCAVWPFEIKQVLGIMGTMQEQWVEPRALVPRDLPLAMSQPLHFCPSVRYDGNICIPASKLTPGLTYDVECDDLRSEVLENLTDEEKESIQEVFNKYDINNDGTVSKKEIEDLVRERTRARRKIVEDKFQEVISSDEHMPEEERASAEESRRQAIQQINEAQAKLIRMFDSADLNGDGLLSLTEFQLAEAWFLRCALNPEKSHLF